MSSQIPTSSTSLRPEGSFDHSSQLTAGCYCCLVPVPVPVHENKAGRPQPLREAELGPSR